MDREAIFRRLIHLSAPVFLIYYFLPSPLWAGGPPREVGLLVAFAVAMIFELARLVLGFRVPGMREYEAEQISASAWSAVALTFALLFFPLEMAAPVIFGMALVDPFISLVRRTKWYPWLPYALHLVIMLTVLSLLVRLDPGTVIAAVVTSVAAIAAEGIKTSYVDDDFLMIVVPLITLWLMLGL
ncbi:MAG: hypothetical protein ISF22_09905 [Methanomassiliicoccus sp.]|nr:hypothetical protein [Methanomassiliicoccus sp.]